VCVCVHVYMYVCGHVCVQVMYIHTVQVMYIHTNLQEWLNVFCVIEHRPGGGALHIYTEEINIKSAPSLPPASQTLLLNGKNPAVCDPSDSHMHAHTKIPAPKLTKCVHHSDGNRSLATDSNQRMRQGGSAESPLSNKSGVRSNSITDSNQRQRRENSISSKSGVHSHGPGNTTHAGNTDAQVKRSVNWSETEFESEGMKESSTVAGEGGGGAPESPSFKRRLLLCETDKSTDLFASMAPNNRYSLVTPEPVSPGWGSPDALLSPSSTDSNTHGHPHARVTHTSASGTRSPTQSGASHQTRPGDLKTLSRRPSTAVASAMHSPKDRRTKRPSIIKTSFAAGTSMCVHTHICVYAFIHI
jgi:hypothetical protein